MIKVFHNAEFQLDSIAGTVSDLSKCVYVADIDTEDLEEAYLLSQNLSKSWLLNSRVTPVPNINKVRSTSSGDFLEFKGERFFVDGIGFKPMK